MTNKAVVKNADLLRGLSNADLFRSRDETRPVLQSAELTFVDAETIRLVATDSYALIVETVPAEVPEEMVGQKRLVNLVDAKPMVVGLKANGKYGATMIELDQRVGITFEEIGSGATYTHKVEGSFPNWEMLVPTEFRPAEEMFALGLWQLARLGKVKVADTKVNDTTVCGKFYVAGSTKPVKVEIARGAVWCLVMPVRTS
jgi:DNA polymerase III sliding clamp (beta) subunit (PCNA family)